jgi:hypothetical protein
MYIEELIQTHWRNTTNLSAAIPADRVFTGPSPIPGLPCGVILHEKSEAPFRTNRPLPWKRGTLAFEVHHDSFDDALRIATVIEREFDRLRLESTDQTEAVRLRLVRCEQFRDGNGPWTLARTFVYSG